MLTAIVKASNTRSTSRFKDMVIHIYRPRQPLPRRMPALVVKQICTSIDPQPHCTNTNTQQTRLCAMYVQMQRRSAASRRALYGCRTQDCRASPTQLPVLSCRHRMPFAPHSARLHEQVALPRALKSHQPRNPWPPPHFALFYTHTNCQRGTQAKVAHRARYKLGGGAAKRRQPDRRRAPAPQHEAPARPPPRRAAAGRGGCGGGACWAKPPARAAPGREAPAVGKGRRMRLVHHVHDDPPGLERRPLRGRAAVGIGRGRLRNGPATGYQAQLGKDCGKGSRTYYTNQCSCEGAVERGSPPQAEPNADPQT